MEASGHGLMFNDFFVTINVVVFLNSLTMVVTLSSGYGAAKPSVCTQSF